MVKVAAVSNTVRRRTSRRTLTSKALLTDLNDDCLIHVFECLDVVSLMKVCKSNPRFKEIILLRIIPFKTIDFSTLSKFCSVRKIFKMVGSSMTRIAIKSSDIQIRAEKHTKFQEFLRLVIENGEPGKLRQLRLAFGEGESNYIHKTPWPILSNAVGPYFENVHTLSFEISQYTEFFHEFMNAMPKHNLRSLSVKHMYNVGDWLTAESMPNLRSLHVDLTHSIPQISWWHSSDENTTLKESKIMAFISSKPPSLVDFHLVGLSHDTVYQHLSRTLPHIERLGEINFWEDRTVNGNNNNGGFRQRNYSEKWKFLTAFTNLKYLKLQSHLNDCSNCGEVFRILANYNTIEEMDLGLDVAHEQQKENPVKVTDIQRLSKLKTLNLTAGDWHADFVKNLLINLPALTNLTVSGARVTHAQIIDFVESVQNLRVLTINCKIVFSSAFYKKLLKLRQASFANPEENRLAIYIEDEKLTSCITELGKKYKPSIITLKSI